MRVCQKCDKQFDDQKLYCPECGGKTSPRPLEKVAEKSSPSEKKKSHKKLMLWLILAGIGISLIMVAVLFLSWFNSDQQKIMRALESGNYQDALDIVQNNNSLRSDDDMVQMLQERILDVKKKYTASQITYSQLTAELDAIEKMKVKKVMPDIEDLRTYAKKLNESRTSFATAEDFLASGDYAEAIKYYGLVIEYDSNFSTAKSKIVEAQNKYRQGVLSEAEEYAKKGDYALAIAVLEDGLKVLPEDDQINCQISIYEKNSADQKKQVALDSAETYAVSGDYLSAITVLENYLKFMPDDMVVTQKLQSYKSSYETKLRADSLKQAADYASYNDYVTAMQVLKNYIDIYGEHVDITVAYNSYKDSYVNAEIAEAETVAQGGDYVGAMGVISDAMKNVADTRLNGKYSSYEKAYVDGIIGESDTLLAKGDYKLALELVEMAHGVLPSNQRLLTQIEKVKNAMPKFLLSVCKPYETSCYDEYTDGQSFRMAAQEFSNGFVLRNSAYAYFNLPSEYTELSFAVGHVDGTSMSDGKFEIYMDGVFVREITVKASELPMQYTLDVSGVKQVVFQCYGNWSHIGIADITIQ